MPWPPAGLCTWAASPASSTRPARYVSATRWCTRKREPHTTSSHAARSRSGPRASSSACTYAALGLLGRLVDRGDDAMHAARQRRDHHHPRRREVQDHLVARHRRRSGARRPARTTRRSCRPRTRCRRTRARCCACRRRPRRSARAAGCRRRAWRVTPSRPASARRSARGRSTRPPSSTRRCEQHALGDSACDTISV